MQPARIQQNIGNTAYLKPLGCGVRRRHCLGESVRRYNRKKNSSAMSGYLGGDIKVIIKGEEKTAEVAVDTGVYHGDGACTHFAAWNNHARTLVVNQNQLDEWNVTKQDLEQSDIDLHLADGSVVHPLRSKDRCQVTSVLTGKTRSVHLIVSPVEEPLLSFALAADLDLVPEDAETWQEVKQELQNTRQQLQETQQQLQDTQQRVQTLENYILHHYLLVPATLQEF